MMNYETLIEMYFKLGDDESVVKVYDKLNRLNLTSLPLPTVEIITVSLLRKNDQLREGVICKNTLRKRLYIVSCSTKIL